MKQLPSPKVDGGWTAKERWTERAAIREDFYSGGDEAHHMLYGRDGTGGSTLQEQLEWLKLLGQGGRTFHSVQVLLSFPRRC